MLCILVLDKEVDIENEGDLTDFSIESNLASPLEEKSWVLLDTYVRHSDQENTEHGFTNTVWNYHLLLGQVLLSLNILLCISWTLTNSTYRVLNFYLILP